MILAWAWSVKYTFAKANFYFFASPAGGGSCLPRPVAMEVATVRLRDSRYGAECRASPRSPHLPQRPLPQP
eukprot:scaffold1166_cov261-Pinguiococcus_pyrenoidosus.AAC.46